SASSTRAGYRKRLPGRSCERRRERENQDMGKSDSSKTQYWLVKQEPEDYPWAQFEKDRGAAWTGVRNFQARNHLRAMRVGDLVAYYHSGKERQVVGIARVAAAAVPDPTAEEGDWSSV